jgi:hypothetical protein
MNDLHLTWEGLGVIMAILGQVGSYVHLMMMQERRFTSLETHVQYLRESVARLGE